MSVHIQFDLERNLLQSKKVHACSPIFVTPIGNFEVGKRNVELNFETPSCNLENIFESSLTLLL